jgi:hypothetical protein
LEGSKEFVVSSSEWSEIEIFLADGVTVSRDSRHLDEVELIKIGDYFLDDFKGQCRAGFARVDRIASSPTGM